MFCSKAAYSVVTILPLILHTIGLFFLLSGYSYKVDAKTGEIIYNRRYIYMEIARETALKDSGCSDVGKVVFTAEELVDGGIKTPYYQFIFNDGRTQWTYRINAISGTILDKAQKLMVCRT